MCFMLEINTLVLEMNTFDAGDEHIENVHLNFSHMHSHSYMCVPATSKQDLSQGDLVTATHFQKWAVSCCGNPRTVDSA